MHAKNFFLILFFAFNISFITAQKRGVNSDSFPKEKGEKPYEMKGRAEARQPLVTFEDCSKWIVESKGAKSDLFRSDEQPLYRDYNGKLVYTATNRKCEITLKIEKPVEILGEWDCIDFWNYGAHWLWGEPKWQTALRHLVLIEDANGKVHEIDFSQAGYGGMIHKYWFLSHIKLNEEIKYPAMFVGVKFKGRNAVPGDKLTVYLGPIYFYKEELKPLAFEKWPEKLPFPLTKETILPTFKQSIFKNSIVQKGNMFEFNYFDTEQKMSYSLALDKGLLNGVELNYKGESILLNKDAEFVFDSESKVNWTVGKSVVINDTLFVQANALVDNTRHPFEFWYTIKHKSLIIGVIEQGKTGVVKEIHLGKTKAGKNSKLITVPFLTYGSGRIPQIFNSNGLFFFKQFDWYYSDASDFIPGRNGIEDGWALYNKGVRYVPKTNGVRSTVREKLFINVSDDVQEVLPTIDNPKSPMRSVMNHRLWMVDGSNDYVGIKKYVKHLSALGLSDVAVRYHEGFWRDGGESYTFRTQTAPGRGGNDAVRELVEYIKGKGWRVGLYSNYTDFAPVNANWNPDWVKRGSDGEWEVSWSRCYSPKPMIAVEQQKKLAPAIHKEFGSNFSYCDVHTAVSPVDRVDYDYRVPGAATFRRSYECFGLLLLNEKKAYHGPVYSEGNYHWWYAGLVDGNYGNSHPSLDKLPVFPDFQLLKIHSLEIDAGNVPANDVKYLAYTLAYGHIGILNGDDEERVRRYAVLQPLQKYYTMIPVTSIRYFDNGKFFNSSEAVTNNLIKAPKLTLEYESGFRAFVNFSDEEWQVNNGGETFTLPQYGFLATMPDGKVKAFYGKSSKVNSHRHILLAGSVNQYYLDTKGDEIETEDFICNGKVFMKKEKFGWEIIPAVDFEYFGFNPKGIGVGRNIQIEGLDENDLPVAQIKYEIKSGKIFFERKNKEILKYRISE